MKAKEKCDGLEMWRT